MIEMLRREVGSAARRFARRPGRPLMGSLALALGIGASTAAFSAVRDVVLRPLPVEDQNELLVVWRRSEARNFDHVPFRPEGVDAVIAAAGSDPLAEVAAVETVGSRPGLAEGVDGTFPIRHVRVAGDFFGVLGARPATGRLLGARDDLLGADPAVVLSHAYWSDAYGADRGAVGTTLRYEDVSYTIVGVAPPGFDYPRGTEAWATLRGSVATWDPAAPQPFELDLIVRVSEGRSEAAVHDEVDRVMRASGFGDASSNDLASTGASFVDLTIGEVTPVLRATLVAALILLAVAIANAALLFLAGGAALLRDGAVRRALGASSRSVVAPLAADATVQAVVGVVLGTGLAWAALAGMIPRAPADLSRFDEVALDLGAVGFAALLGIVGVVGSAGLAGAWLLRRDPSELLQSGGRRSGGGGQALRRSIAIGQVALAVVASAGAGLLWRSVGNLEALDRGFEPAGLSVVALALPFDFFSMPDGYTTALADVADRLGSRPGISGAAATINPPLSVRGGIDFVPRIDGQSAEDARNNPYLGFDAVSRQYFDVAQTRIVEGRGFGREDGPEGAPTMIVNELAARQLWPGRSALGRQLFLGGLSRNEWRTVVGVVESHRFRSFPEARPAAYVPLAQYERFPPSRILVRGEPADATLRAVVEEEFASSFPDVDVLTVDALSPLMDGPLVRPRFAASVLIFFSGVTLLLAALGVHGVFMVLVQERRRELGIRKALGAGHLDLVRFVVARVMLVATVGALLGLGASVWTGGFLDALFFEVSVLDAETMLTVAVATIAAGLIAGVAPVLGAVRTDPVESLRAE